MTYQIQFTPAAHKMVTRIVSRCKKADRAIVYQSLLLAAHVQRILMRGIEMESIDPVTGNHVMYRTPPLMIAPKKKRGRTRAK